MDDSERRAHSGREYNYSIAAQQTMLRQPAAEGDSSVSTWHRGLVILRIHGSQP
jgi:hypothetical protein